MIMLKFTFLLIIIIDFMKDRCSLLTKSILFLLTFFFIVLLNKTKTIYQIIRISFTGDISSVSTVVNLVEPNNDEKRSDLKIK